MSGIISKSFTSREHSHRTYIFLDTSKQTNNYFAILTVARVKWGKLQMCTDIFIPAPARHGLTTKMIINNLTLIHL